MGDVRKVHGSWIGRFYGEDGRRISVTLGRASEITKSDARAKLAEILKPINASSRRETANSTFEDFVTDTFFPWKRKKCKISTAMTNEERIKTHLLSDLGKRLLRDITDTELQGLLDHKVTLSFSTVEAVRGSA